MLLGFFFCLQTHNSKRNISWTNIFQCKCRTLHQMVGWESDFSWRHFSKQHQKKKKFRSLLQFMSKRHREKWNFIVFPTVKYIISNYAIPVVLRHCADWMKKLLFLFQLYFLSLSLLSFLFKLQSSTTFIFTRNKTIKSNPKMNCKMLFRVWKTTKRKKKIHTQKKMS